MSLSKSNRCDDGASDENDENVLHLRSPMPGLVEKVFIKLNERVSSDQTLITMTAMKMEYLIKFRVNRRIVSVNTKPGDTVDSNKLLIVMTE